MYPRMPSCTAMYPRVPSLALMYRVSSRTLVCPPNRHVSSCTLACPHVPPCTLMYPRMPSCTVMYPLPCPKVFSNTLIPTVTVEHCPSFCFPQLRILSLALLLCSDLIHSEIKPYMYFKVMRSLRIYFFSCYFIALVYLATRLRRALAVTVSLLT